MTAKSLKVMATPAGLEPSIFGLKGQLLWRKTATFQTFCPILTPMIPMTYGNSLKAFRTANGE